MYVAQLQGKQVGGVFKTDVDAAKLIAGKLRCSIDALGRTPLRNTDHLSKLFRLLGGVYAKLKGNQQPGDLVDLVARARGNDFMNMGDMQKSIVIISRPALATTSLVIVA